MLKNLEGKLEGHNRTVIVKRSLRHQTKSSQVVDVVES